MSKFTINTQTGIQDIQVKDLQKFLNTLGFKVAKDGNGSLGKETSYFGLLTKKALAKFQKENGIKPATGYFGPITRKFVNQMIQKSKGI